MKIVQVEDFFHPNAGYQVNVLSKYFVKFGHSVTILTATMDCIPKYLTSFFEIDNVEELDKKYEKKYGARIRRISAKKYISGRVIFDMKLFDKVIMEENPDVLYVHGNDTFSAIWVFLHLHKYKCKVISDTHMTAIASKNRFSKIFRLIYKLFITPIIRKNNITVIKTADDPYVNEYLGVPKEQTPIISFGSDTMLFHPDKEKREIVRNKYNISNEDFVIIYAGKIDEYKGGLFLADITNCTFDIPQKIVYLIIGNSIGDYGKQVEERMLQSKNRVIRIPTQAYENLAQYYQASDLAIIPKQCSLSLYDMQACGLPVLAENNDINKKRLSFSNGWVFNANSVESYSNVLFEILNMTIDEFSIYSKNSENIVKEKYDYAIKAKEYEKKLMGS